MNPPLYEPDPDATYTLEMVATETGISIQVILQYQEHGLIAPVPTAPPGQAHYDDEALRTLQRIEHLRATCNPNLAGLKLMIELMDEVERLRADLRRSWR